MRRTRVGGGATYWPAARLGLRFDAFRFLPVATDTNIPAEERSPSRYWGVRAGVAFRFRRGRSTPEEADEWNGDLRPL